MDAAGHSIRGLYRLEEEDENRAVRGKLAYEFERTLLSICGGKWVEWVGNLNQQDGTLLFIHSVSDLHREFIAETLDPAVVLRYERVLRRIYPEQPLYTASHNLKVKVKWMKHAAAGHHAPRDKFRREMYKKVVGEDKVERAIFDCVCLANPNML